MPTIKELIQQQEARQEHDRRHAHAKSTLPQAPMWLWHMQPPILMAPTGRHGELEPQGRVGCTNHVLAVNLPQACHTTVRQAFFFQNKITFLVKLRAVFVSKKECECQRHEEDPESIYEDIGESCSPPWDKVLMELIGRAVHERKRG